MKDDIHQFIAEEAAKHRPLQKSDITINGLMRQYGLGYQTASNILTQLVEAGKLVKGYAVVRGRRVNVYREVKRSKKAG